MEYKNIILETFILGSVLSGTAILIGAGINIIVGLFKKQ